MEILIRFDEMIVEKLAGDLYTPITIFQLLQGKNKFLLESSLKHTDAGRYSYIGANPAFHLICKSEQCEIVFQNGKRTIVEEEPLEYLKKLFSAKENLASDLPFLSGGIGYFSYDMMEKFYEIKNDNEDELEMPKIHLMFYEQVIAYDHLKEEIYLIGLPLLKQTTSEQVKANIEKTIDDLKATLERTTEDDFTISDFEQSITRQQFIDKVNLTLDEMKDENISQVVLSQRLFASYEGEPFSYYRKLRLANPSPYMFYIDFNDYIIAGSSPESLMKVLNNKIITNPIAGTRHRGMTVEEDARLERELLNDLKELSEHEMLVNLSRSELETVCRKETITVEKSLQIEKYEHVMHLVSVLSGELSESATVIDGLTACLPAGTVSGSPKKKAMEIINKYEEKKRGVYGGAVGYLSFDGNCNLALAIRMIIFKNNQAYLQAGAGIVNDSVAELEYEETIHKLKTLLTLK